MDQCQALTGEVVQDPLGTLAVRQRVLTLSSSSAHHHPCVLGELTEVSPVVEALPVSPCTSRGLLSCFHH